MATRERSSVTMVMGSVRPLGVRTAVSRVVLAAILMVGAGASSHPILSNARAGEPGPHALDPLEVRVNAAIERGSRWLLSCMKENGTFSSTPPPGLRSAPRQSSEAIGFGQDMLCTLALLQGLDGRSIPWSRRSLRLLKSKYHDCHSTYGSSLCLLFLAALEEQRVRGEASGWPHTMVIQRRLPHWGSKAAAELGGWLLDSRAANGLWRYGRPGEGFDLSNTQYACMGLLAAKRLGMEVPSEAAWSIAQAVLSMQIGRATDPESGGAGAPPSSTDPRHRMAEARGFKYQHEPDQLCQGSTTAAGLAALGAVRLVLRLNNSGMADSPLLSAGIEDGLAWLEKNYTVSCNPIGSPGVSSIGIKIPPAGSNQWHAYYLYALERACAVCGRDLVGAHDWYRDGATLLVERQSSDGSWILARTGRSRRVACDSRLTDTSFALLFLRRATTRLMPPVTPAAEAPITGR